jgi:hypothetical protein
MGHIASETPSFLSVVNQNEYLTSLIQDTAAQHRTDEIRPPHLLAGEKNFAYTATLLIIAVLLFRKPIPEDSIPR